MQVAIVNRCRCSLSNCNHNLLGSSELGLSQEAMGRRSMLQKLNAKTAAIISVLVLCAVYSFLLDFHYHQIYQRLYSDRRDIIKTLGVSSIDAPQREEEAGQSSHQQVQQQQVQQNSTRGDSPKYAAPSFKVDAYSFPTVQERLRYYMGDWFNKTEWSVPDCNLVNEELNHSKIIDQDRLLTTKTIKQCMYSGLSIPNSIGNTYCKDAYSFTNATEASRRGRDDAHWLVRFGFGDRLTELGNQLPIITKARPSLLSDHPKTPLWLLNKNRHYNELDRYHNKVVRGDGEVPWSEKVPKLFWRGSTTGNRAGDAGRRLDFLAQWVHHNDKKIDIGFNNVVQMTSTFQHEYIERHYSRKGKGAEEGRESLHDMNRYKYLLSIEGNDVASGLKWMLYSNSVVFMARPTVATWAMEDLLIPFVHYIPVANDYSNLLEMVHWAEEHDEASHEISRRATEYIEHLWISDQAKRDTEMLKKAMATMYMNQFDHALSQCSKVTDTDESVKVKDS